MSFILDALKSFGEWIWNGLCAIGNAIIRAITWFFQTVFINPIVGLFNLILNRIREKLKGIIFIIVTVPWTIREIRQLVEKPTAKGFLKLLFKPLIGYAVSEIGSAIISSFMFPVTVRPPTIPTLSPFPPAPPPPPIYLDDIIITDKLSIAYFPTTQLSDSIAISDELSVAETKTVSLSNSIPIEDSLSAEYQIATNLYDNISISDSLELPLSHVKTITISRNVYTTTTDKIISVTRSVSIG
jgi:hypothetical protein